MNKSPRWLLLLSPLVLSLSLLACKSLPENPVDMGPLPMLGNVKDVPEFERFIATRPTPEMFHKRYPDVVLVMPWDIASKELRLNNSRYFAQMDDQGRITQGKFE